MSLFQVSAYNVPFGKKNRGMSVLMSYRLMKPEASEEDIRLARILGWCVEWVCYISSNLSFVVTDQ